MTERSDILETLANHRGFLLHTVDGLSDEQARLHPTVSALCLGGLVKHVTAVETSWCNFIEIGPPAMAFSPERMAERDKQFELAPDETVAAVVAAYEDAIRRTDKLVSDLPSLDDSQPLPDAPWFEKGKRWSARRVLLHLIAETSQHAGHADIIREAIDGQKTMG